jgi:hypothetical protein
MGRPDMFIASQRQMWSDQTYMVRSRAERARLQRARALVAQDTPEDVRAFQGFADKVRSILGPSALTEAPVWNGDDRLLLHTLLLSMYEKRSTQTLPYRELAIVMLRAIDPFPGEVISVELIARLLENAGIIPAHDSLTTSALAEDVARDMAMAGLEGHEVNAAIATSQASARTTEVGAASSSAPSTTMPHKQVGPGDFLRGDELDAIRHHTSERVWVIDDPTAVELDDGISLRRIEGSDDVWIDVHVADPTRLIPIDHPMALRASFFGAAQYLPEGNVPLYDLSEMASKLSLGGGSQGGGGDAGQSVLTFSARLSKDGQLKDRDVRLGYISRPRLTTYAEVDTVLGTPSRRKNRPFGKPIPSTTRDAPPSVHRPPVSPDEHPDLQLLHSIACARRVTRTKERGLDFHSGSADVSVLAPRPPQAELFYHPDHLPARYTPPSACGALIDWSVPADASSDTLDAANVVSELMLLAGQIAGAWCAERNIAIPYRGAPAPSVIKSLHKPNADSTDALAGLMARRTRFGHVDPYLVRAAPLSFLPGEVGVRPLDHFTLGMRAAEGGYTRATSPLRRFDDFMVHWQIKAFLASAGGAGPGAGAGVFKALDEADTLTLAQRVHAAQARLKHASVAAARYWQAGLMGERLAAQGLGGVGAGAGASARAAPLLTTEEERDRYDRDEMTHGPQMLDMRSPLEARVWTPPVELSPGWSGAEVRIEALGCTARVQAPSKAVEGWEVGRGVRVRVRVGGVKRWPVGAIEVEVVE